MHLIRQAGSLATTADNHSSSQKTRLNYLSHGIKIWTDFSSVLSQCTCLTDRLTDRNLIARPRLHSMQRDNSNTDVIISQLGYTVILAVFTLFILKG